MEKYRKKPVIVQGFQWDGTLEMLRTEIPETSWNDFHLLDINGSVTINTIESYKELGFLKLHTKNAVSIRTVQGWQTCVTGDYIIQSKTDEDQAAYHSLKANEFKQQYDLI